MKFVCQKQFKGEGNYTKKDIKIFNEVIENGIKELKGDWKDTQGVYLIETDKELQIEIKPHELNSDEFPSLRGLRNDIEAVIDNYAVPYAFIN